jgi:hypothetical protein
MLADGHRQRSGGHAAALAGAEVGQCLHGNIVGARGRQRQCCGVGGAAAGHQWQ